ncbi:MAG: ornithine carbamoyltransferase [Acidobacteria bacterium]|nr:ornithine carbamoyltransferase [Acidobacteriota bacterium]
MNKYTFRPGPANPLVQAPKPPAALPFAASDLVYDDDLTAADVHVLLNVASQMRRNPGDYSGALSGRTLALLFEKPSLRTRVTFEVAMKGLGGDAIFIDCRGEPLGVREPVRDVARNLDRWVSAIAARTFRQSTVEELAEWAGIPVINALSDRVHPCQALADMLTLLDHFGHLAGIKLAYVGDGNNVAHSLLLTGSKLGVDISIACPPSYEPDAAIVAKARQTAVESGSSVRIVNDPLEAVAGADAIYTDVWTSMGAEHEANSRKQHFMPYQVNEEMFGAAAPNAVFMHCLPAHRGEEVANEVIESQRSVVFDQAENRLHAQKALLWLLLSQ